MENHLLIEQTELLHNNPKISEIQHKIKLYKIISKIIAIIAIGLIFLLIPIFNVFEHPAIRIPFTFSMLISGIIFIFLRFNLLPKLRVSFEHIRINLILDNFEKQYPNEFQLRYKLAKSERKTDRQMVWYPYRKPHRTLSTYIGEIFLIKTLLPYDRMYILNEIVKMINIVSKIHRKYNWFFPRDRYWKMIDYPVGINIKKHYQNYITSIIEDKSIPIDKKLALMLDIQKNYSDLFNKEKLAEEIEFTQYLPNFQKAIEKLSKNNDQVELEVLEKEIQLESELFSKIFQKMLKHQLFGLNYRYLTNIVTFRNDKQ